MLRHTALILALLATLTACQSMSGGGASTDGAKAQKIYVSYGEPGDEPDAVSEVTAKCTSCNMEFQAKLTRKQTGDPQSVFVPLGEPGDDGYTSTVICSHCGKKMSVEICHEGK